MLVTAIRTKKVQPHDVIEHLFEDCYQRLKPNDVVAVTSKVISLCEGAVVSKKSTTKEELIQLHAQEILCYDEPPPYGIVLTIAHDMVIPTAGIDESNGEGIYILYPKDPFASAYRIWQHLRDVTKIDTLGVVVTDSTTAMLRSGVRGVALSWCGFEPLKSYIGQKDCFGNELRVTRVNLVDALAASAVYEMGEGDEQTPIAIISNARSLTFMDHPPSKTEIGKVRIPMEQDIFAPILKKAQWKKGLSSCGA